MREIQRKVKDDAPEGTPNVTSRKDFRQKYVIVARYSVFKNYENICENHPICTKLA